MLKYEDYLEQTPLLFKREVFENVAKKFPALDKVEWKDIDLSELYDEEMFNEYNLTYYLIDYILGDIDISIIEEECDFDNKQVVLDDEYCIDLEDLETAKENLEQNGWTISNYDSIIENMKKEEQENGDRDSILEKISKLDIADLRRIELNYC